MSELKYKVGDEVVLEGRESLAGTAEDYASETVRIINIIGINPAPYKAESKDGETMNLYESEIKCLAGSEFKINEIVEARDHCSSNWKSRIYLFSANNRHYCVNNTWHDNYRIDKKELKITGWNFIQKIEEPDIEITVKLKGKEVRLRDVSLQTLEKIREES